MTARTTAATREESGFTLIEVVVALFLLGILAVMVLPSLVTSLRTTSNNSTIATASQLVNEQLEDARLQSPTCSALQTWATVTVVPVVDARGVSLQPSRAAVTCPASYPGTVTITVAVAKTGVAGSIATATTKIFVSSAS